MTENSFIVNYFNVFLLLYHNTKTKSKLNKHTTALADKICDQIWETKKLKNK